MYDRTLSGTLDMSNKSAVGRIRGRVSEILS